MCPPDTVGGGRWRFLAVGTPKILKQFRQAEDLQVPLLALFFLGRFNTLHVAVCNRSPRCAHFAPGRAAETPLRTAEAQFHRHSGATVCTAFVASHTRLLVVPYLPAH